MNLEFVHLLDPGFSPASRVWIYQSSRLFSLGEALEIEESLQAYTQSWKSHGAAVKAAGYLFFGQFIILMADESAVSVGGCSTDDSVRFIKQLEQRYQVQLFDRTTLAFVVNEKIQLLPLGQFPYAVTNGFITPDTLYFNNTVLTKAELESNWIIPVRASWLAKRLPEISTV